MGRDRKELMWMVEGGAVCAEMTNEVLMVSGGARDC